MRRRSIALLLSTCALAGGWAQQSPTTTMVDPNATEADKREAQVWRQLQSELVAFSSHGSLMIAGESGHDIQNEPDLVVQAIRRVIALADSSR